ncbi:hypothetical protein OE88DRAFT_1666945 [Heliocybe sulcata]|uniref:Alcohol dehydrogenase-like N-terminal domain-containing protein n=1 Tax=Heliocybe sulcata TaxID=5364 RepID=A0A5C3MZ30_9AGAM|nr:hypothetical protein OE88DRAFT_1666945 [Heliocybe sulcata]
MSYSSEGTQTAVRWYPPAYDVRVESVPLPSIEYPDDAIVKIKLGGLCGSDLHVYRGHEDVDAPLICGHEFVGEVVALGASFGSSASGRPPLYSTLQIGDKVVSPFTVTCGECHFCRVGSTCRCVHSQLFGIPALPGGQAQYVRVPKAGGTLFKIEGRMSQISDSSLILLGDILPTGVFAVLQALQHPKLLPAVTSQPYPFSSQPFAAIIQENGIDVPRSLIREEDKVLTIAVVGLGPVGICTIVSLLDILSKSKTAFKVVAIDPIEDRRNKVQEVYKSIQENGRGNGTFEVASINEGKNIVSGWTNGTGCNAVLEIVGNNSALLLAYDLVRPFGVISSVGVHQGPQLPFTGRQVYDKNVSFEFGRCPVRAILPIALEVLLKRQDVFGGVGEAASLVEKIVGFDQAVESYELFDKGKCGKVLFDPWR